MEIFCNFEPWISLSFTDWLRQVWAYCIVNSIRPSLLKMLTCSPKVVESLFDHDSFFFMRVSVVIENCPLHRVATKFPRQNYMTFQWIFHDQMTKFHDRKPSSLVYMNCRGAAPVYKVLDLLVKFHDFSMTFCPYFKIPWLFHDLDQFWSKFHDFSRKSRNFKNSRNSMTFPWPWQPWSIYRRCYDGPLK